MAAIWSSAGGGQVQLHEVCSGDWPGTNIPVRDGWKERVYLILSIES